MTTTTLDTGAATTAYTVTSPAVEPAIADPGPLGLAAFALTTFMLSTFNAGLLPKTVEAVVLPVALFYGGIAQVLAGMWEFKKNNTFGALAFTSYGAFWLSFAGLVKYVAADLPAADAEKGIGLFLLAWTIFTLYMTLAALRTSPILTVVFVALSATFILLTLGAFASSSAISHLGGWLGLLTAALAWYASAAGVTAATFHRQILPTGSR
jgi:succinate-acetate transporter protein